MTNLNVSPAVQIGIRCKICQQTKGASNFISISDVRGSICENCYGWHLEAMRVLQGEQPRGCQVCNRTFAQLCLLNDGNYVEMFLHPLDGIYQILCPHCSEQFEKKSPMYKETLYGWLKKLAGWR